MPNDTMPPEGEQPLYPSEDCNTLTTGQFLKLYFSQCDTGYVEIAYLAPPELKLYPRTVTAWRPLPVLDVPDSPEQIMTQNKRGYGAYFGTTVSGVKYPPEERIAEKSGRPYLLYQRRKEKDVTLAPALWVDIDDVTPEEGLTRLMKLPIFPSIVVRSGGGVHGYFLLGDPVEITPDNKNEFKRVLHGLANCCGGDTKARDMARIMRLPGTVNTKPSRVGARCEVIDYMPGWYQYEQLRGFFIHHAPREIIQTTRTIPTTGNIQNLPKRTTSFINSPPSAHRCVPLYAAARGCNDAGLSLSEAEGLLLAPALSTGLPEKEVIRTIRNAYKAPSEGMLPDYMRLRMAMGDKLGGAR